MVARRRAWLLALIAIAAGGLLVRLVYVLAFKNPLPLIGDASYYHVAANLLADGKGFVAPVRVQYGFLATESPAADHPPGYIALLALPSVLGFGTALAHQIWSCVIGTATIVVVGFTGRTIAGPRVGLIAAALAAFSPNFWLNDGLLMSETLTLLTAALTVLAAYRFWQRPTGLRAGVLGLAIALLVFTRAEALLLIPLLVVPLAVIAVKRDWRRGGALALIATGVTVGVLAPWIIHNQVRFERPVFVSTNLGWTMQSGNCDETYGGFALGYWSLKCAEGAKIDGDYSVQDEEYRKRARDYITGHLAQLPWIIVAREGRTFGYFRPDQQLHFDQFETTREVEAATVGLFLFYALVPLSFIGASILRSRDVPVVPLVSLIVTVALTVALTFGQTRYRAPAEISFALLGAVAIDAGLGRVRRRRIERPERAAHAADELVTTS